MKKVIHPVWALVLCCALLVGTLGTSLASGTPAAATYPLQTDVTLTYWLPMSVSVSPNFQDFGDTPLAQELEKRTGVKVEYLHPVIGQEKDAFNILVASGDLPDIVEYGWGNASFYPSGPDAAIANNLILQMNDVFTQYAPNYRAFLDANPALEKAAKTDSGAHYGFTFWRDNDPILAVFQGPIIRNDWLAEAGLGIPETMDEWYAALTAFKARGVAGPLSWAGSDADPLKFFNIGNFVGAYGVTRDFFLDDNGDVKYGPAEPAYKDFLTEMAKWYKEGLIDPNFASMDRKAFDAAFLDGQVGSFTLLAGGGLSKYVPALAEVDAKGDLQPAPFPVLNKGDRPQFGHWAPIYTGDVVYAISAKSKNVEIATRWLDYGYTEEGQLLYNFGIEGVSYEMVDGKPTMTDEVMKNPDGLPVAQAWCKYARGPYSGPFVLERDMQIQYRTMPIQNKAVEVWMETDMAKHIMPGVTPTEEESARFAKLYNDIKTYADEFALKVVMGEESIDGFDAYIAQINKMGIQEVIALRQAAVERFRQR